MTSSLDLQLGLKPPFWLLSLPLFLVLYRNTATIQQSEDKREDCQGEPHLEDKRVNGDGEDEGVDGDGGGNGEDKAEDGEGEFLKIDNFQLLSCPWPDSQNTQKTFQNY